MTEPLTLHVTSVAIDGRAVLIGGPSGAGKSDLALRLIDRGAILVSDDYTIVAPSKATLLASPPATIAGKMEVRGVGILTLPFVSEARVALLVDLGGAPVRLPEPAVRIVAGVALPVVSLAALEPSAPLKVEAALQLHGLA
jgi:serine kinase of HPr protein (carbohydrate metabolism regulator)